MSRHRLRPRELVVVAAAFRLVFACAVGAACPAEADVRADLVAVAGCRGQESCGAGELVVRVLNECSPKRGVGEEIVVWAGNGCAEVPESAAERAAWIRSAIVHAQAHRCLGEGDHLHYDERWRDCCSAVKADRGVTCQ